MKTINILTVFFLIVFSVENIEAQLKVNAAGKVGIATTPSNGLLEVGTTSTFNISGTYIGGDFRLGNYGSTSYTAFIQARNNSNQTYGITS
jgi:hypothetical protein